MFTLRFTVSKVLKTAGNVHVFVEFNGTYKGITNISLWTNPFDGEELICKLEIDNPCDTCTQAVAMKKEICYMLQVVLHLVSRVHT